MIRTSNEAIRPTRPRAVSSYRRTASRCLRSAGITIVATGIALNGASWWLSSAFAFFGRRSVSTDALDFSAFYPAAYLVAHGRAHELYEIATYRALAHNYGVHALAAGQTLPFLNPPFFALALSPLGAFSFDVAFQAWTAVNLTALAVVLLVVWRAASSHTLLIRVAIIGLLITARPVPFSLQLGQFSLLLLAAWTGAFLSLRRGRNVSAALCLAACTIKPEVLLPLLLLLVWHRRWGVVAPFAVACAILAAVSLGVVGAGGAVDYPAFVIGGALHHGAGTQTDLMMGWNAALDGFVRGRYPGMETLIAVPVSLATLAILAWACRDSVFGHDDATFAARWLLITIAAMLVDPHFYLQDAAILLAPACFCLITAPARLRLITWAGVLAGWYVLSLGFQPNLEWGIALVPIYMFCVFMAVVVLMDRHARLAHSTEPHRRQNAAMNLKQAA